MELLFISSVFVVAVLLLFIVSPRRRNPSLPPSPFKIPIIGNLHQLGLLPHRSLRSLSLTHGPLMSISLGQVPAIVVSSSAAAEEVLKTHDLAFASRPFSKATAVLSYGPSNVSFSPYSDRWRRSKKHAVVHLLSPGRVLSSRPVREEAVRALIQSVVVAGAQSVEVDLTGLLKRFAAAVSSGAATGRVAREEGRGPDLREEEDDESALLSGFQVFDSFPAMGWVSRVIGLDAKLEAIWRRRDELMRRVLDDHRRRPPSGEDEKDFVDVLLSLAGQASGGGQQDARISEDEVKAIVIDMVAAGSDTTYTVVDWTIAELVRNQTLMKRAQAEIRSTCTGRPIAGEDDLSGAFFLKAVVKETLRLHPPAPLLIPHESTADAVVMGFRIPAKTRVIINAWAMQRDPGTWEDPEEFRPQRFLDRDVDFRGQDFSFIPFGAGRRMCPGISLAMATVHLALANLLLCFDWSLPDASEPWDMDMSEAPGITAPRKTKLRLVATQYFA